MMPRASGVLVLTHDRVRVASAQETFETGGYYSVDVSSNLTVAVVNALFYTQQWCSSNTTQVRSFVALLGRSPLTQATWIALANSVCHRDRTTITKTIHQASSRGCSRCAPRCEQPSGRSWSLPTLRLASRSRTSRCGCLNTRPNGSRSCSRCATSSMPLDPPDRS